MGDYTSRMTSLLGEMRRERNGAVAEALDRALPASLRYGLNLGVSLPSVRAIARKVSPDHGFSKYLYRQDVRELRLAALWIAEPACVGAEELSFWMRDPMPSELIEELAFALLSRAPVERELMEWLERPEADFAYAAVMALARGAGCDRTGVVHRLGSMLARHPADLRLAQGAAALLTALAADEPSRADVRALVASFGSSPAQAFLRDEMAWRLEG